MHKTEARFCFSQKNNSTLRGKNKGMPDGQTSPVSINQSRLLILFFFSFFSMKEREMKYALIYSHEQVFNKIITRVEMS